MNVSLRAWIWGAFLLFPWIALTQPQSQPTSKPNGGLTTFDPTAPITSPQTTPPENAQTTQPPKKETTSFASTQDVPEATPLIPVTFDPEIAYFYGPNRSVRQSIYATAIAGAAAGVVVGAAIFTESESIRGGLAAITALAIAPSLGRFTNRGIRAGLLYSALRFPAALFIVTTPKLIAEGEPELSATLLLALSGYTLLSTLDIYRTYILYPAEIQKSAHLQLAPIVNHNAYGVALQASF